MVVFKRLPTPFTAILIQRKNTLIIPVSEKRFALTCHCCKIIPLAFSSMLLHPPVCYVSQAFA